MNYKLNFVMQIFKTAALVAWSVTAFSGELVLEDSSEKDALCKAVQNRVLDFYKGKSPDTRCNSWDVISTFPDFVEPPWQELDPEANRELLFKLLRSGYVDVFSKLPKNIVEENDLRIRKNVDRFIQAGGRMRMWKVSPGLLNFSDKGQSGNIVDDEVIIETGISPERSTICIKTPHTTWQGHSYIIAHDINGPIFWTAPAKFGSNEIDAAGELYNSHLFLYKDQPVLINSEEIFRFDSGRLKKACNLHFVERK